MERSRFAEGLSPTIASAIADLPLCSDGNRIANRLATQRLNNNVTVQWHFFIKSS
ncbi:MAG: hypothetical protein LBC02_00675 [Planctomycetaceae bacterium]|nr:hypothetical protein [Planctomycetaceae bacterium]